MSIFQVVCTVLFVVVVAVFGICVYLYKEGVDEGEFIGLILCAMCIFIGLFSLLLGAIGLLKVDFLI